MIKFFRRLRHKFVNTGQSSKYISYAIGEIILVVIGILIALQINNWNENRINSKKEKGYLIGLKNDLEKQIQTFKGRDKFYDLIIDKGEAILVDFSATGHLVEIDSINSKLSLMMYSLKYPEIRTSFNELNTTGHLNLIKRKSLRSHIIKYYQGSESTEQSVNSNINEVFYANIFPFIKSSVIIHPENLGVTSGKVDNQLIDTQLTSTFENNLSNPYKEFEIVNAISLRIIVAKTNKGSIQTATTNAEDLLKLINQELND